MPLKQLPKGLRRDEGRDVRYLENPFEDRIGIVANEVTEPPRRVLKEENTVPDGIAKDSTRILEQASGIDPR